MTPECYSKLLARYKTEFGFSFLVCDESGMVVFGDTPRTDCSCRCASNAKRIEAARQTLSFGEPIIGLCCENGFGQWAVPLMQNARLTGALVVQGIDLESGEADISRRVRKAAQGLFSLAIQENLTNAAALQVANEQALKERERFLVIEASKEAWSKDELRTTYLREEPGLLTAIKEGRTQEARSILNRILTSIYSIADENMELLKSSVLELVVMMSRAAVEAGADPSLLLGNNYRFITDLSAIDDEEDLAVWLRNMLEALIEQIHQSEAYPHFIVLNKALTYMEEHLHEPLKRDDVATHVGMSPSHFSKVMTERLGRSFTELLNQYRINRAKHLIVSTSYNLSAIALECGFFDQSHLSRTFRKATGLSPGAYRKKRLNGE
ncbi:MAG: helix-turn-helix domain-containing protein [Puniceicoccaceae bacterium]